MREVTINTTSFGTAPYDVYVCNVYGNFCTFIAQLSTDAPPVITLPSPFDSYPAVGVKIIDSNCCEKLVVTECTLT